MEEISGLHELNIEWGCITNLMDKISEIEDKIEGGWPELIDMVADAVTKEGESGDAAELFFSLYQFLFRLYHRLKVNDAVREFNTVYKLTTRGKEVYRVVNYDYKTFKWAKSGGLMDGVSNDYMDDALRRTEEAIAISLEDVRDTRTKFKALIENQEKKANAVLDVEE